jgi:anthranilate phosphoribosyltransferase
MERLGYKFTNDIGELQRKIETAGICFLHAPLFHPAMKKRRADSKELGVKTFFNVWGPMVNPSGPNKHWWGYIALNWPGFMRTLSADRQAIYGAPFARWL